MKTLNQLCNPRKSVFDPSKRDIVLDLSDLIENKINADEFFEENYMTDGMQTLLREAFRRFERKSTQGVFKLTQAMGGGKTHNLLVLGLLANNPQLRKNVMGSIYESKDLGPVRVVAFSGRESDAPGDPSLSSLIKKRSSKIIILLYQPLGKQRGLTY